MKKITSQKLAKLLYDNYPDSDLLSISPLTDTQNMDVLSEAVGICGSSLFKLIVNDINEVCKQSDGSFSFDLIEDLLQNIVNKVEYLKRGLD